MDERRGRWQHNEEPRSCENKEKKIYACTIPLNTEAPSLSTEQRTAKNNPWCDEPRRGGGEGERRKSMGYKMQGGEGLKGAENGGHKRG